MLDNGRGFAPRQIGCRLRTTKNTAKERIFSPFSWFAVVSVWGEGGVGDAAVFQGWLAPASLPCPVQVRTWIIIAFDRSMDCIYGIL